MTTGDVVLGGMVLVVGWHVWFAAFTDAGLLGEGEVLRLRGAPGSGSGRALLLAGVPLNEPVVHYGPFVMNTEQQIRQAIADYRSGRMGEITRTAQVR